ncbi:cytochrome P450, partial [Trifolium medium]|nr:cytochrome P450 [Trifolium medium]
MGVNVSSEFLGVAERFLHCRIGSIPFIYLGLPVGENHRKEVTWQPLLDSLAKTLGVWRN